MERRAPDPGQLELPVGRSRLRGPTGPRRARFGVAVGAVACTIGLVKVFPLDLVDAGPLAWPSAESDPGPGLVCTYRAAGGIVVAALASDLEGDIVGGVALDLEGAGRQVVEVLVEELEGGTVSR